MTPLTRMVIGVVLLTALAAAAGGWAGVQYGLREASSGPGLDEFLHHELDLTADQEQRIEAMESEFATRREAFEDEMRAANRDLAAAIEADHVYGPRAQSAIERFHGAESALQEETIKHVFAMRTVLMPEQVTRFDEAVVTALTSD